MTLGLLVPLLSLAILAVVAVLAIRSAQRSNKALREAERRLLQFVSHLPGYAFTYRITGDYQGYYPFVSPGVEDVVGLKPEELAVSDAKLMERIFPEDLVRIGELALKAIETRTSYVLECRIHHPVKGERWLESRAAPEIQADGTVDWHGFSLDITERKEMEARLRKSEQDFRSLAEHSPDNIARYDSQMRIVYMNPALIALLGLSLSQVLGTKATQVAHDPYLAEYQKTLARVLSSGREATMSFQSPDRQNRLRHYNAKMIPERNADGAIIGALAIARDVTELHEAQEQFKDVFENAADSLFLLEVTPDLRFRNLAINPALERACGIPREQMLGKLIEETVPPEEAAKAVAKYRRCVEAGTQIELEEEFNLPSGKKVFHSTLVPKRDATGRIHRIVGITRDITTQRENEAILHAREQEFRAVVETSSDHIVRYDKQCRRVYVNPAFERFNDLTGAQLLGRRPGEAPLTQLSQSDALVIREHVAQVLQAARADEFNLEGVTVSNRPFAFSIRVSPEFDQKGQVTGVLMITHDVTELQERNSYLLALSEGRRLAEIRALEAQVNPHFLYNTLNALNWMAIEANQPAISRGLRDLAAITRYSISQFHVTATLAEEVQWMRKYLDLQCMRFGKSFEYSVRDEGADPGFRMYKLLFQPLLENAIIHGFDESESGGFLEVSFTILADRRLQTVIRDNGKGFEIGTKAAPGGPAPYSSVGLENLAQRLRAYYGDQAVLETESRPGAGTTVTILFPEVVS